MRNTWKAAGSALALAVLTVLAGCAQSTPQVIPTSEPSVAPVFASNAAALAAAKKAYVAYLAVSDSVAQDGGADPDRFSSVVTTSWLKNERASAATLVATERRQLGRSRATNLMLQQTSQRGHLASVSIYACLDLSGVQYVDSMTGDNPTQPTTQLIPVEVNFQSSPTIPMSLLVERNTPWQGRDFCPRS